MVRKKLLVQKLVVLAKHEAANGRVVAVAPRDRASDFGEKWIYAPAPEARNYIQLQPHPWRRAGPYLRYG